LFSTLSDAIENYYKDEIKTMAGKVKIKKWIESFFNEITDILRDDFINYSKTKNIKWSVLLNTWYLFIGLSIAMRNKKNWENTLKNIINKIDWSIEQNPYKDITSKKKLVEITNNFVENIMK
jgi:hypothetical protein